MFKGSNYKFMNENSGKKYFDTDRQVVLSYEDMVQHYIDNVHDDHDNFKSISFDDYMNDCLSKNGCLKEIRTLTEDEKKKIISALKAVDRAYYNFMQVMSDITEDSYTKSMNDSCPFKGGIKDSDSNLSIWLDDIFLAVVDDKLTKVNR